MGHIFADGGYRGQLVAIAKSAWNIVLEIVKKLRGPPTSLGGRAHVPWLLRWRRLARDYERLPERTKRWSSGRWSA